MTRSPNPARKATAPRGYLARLFADPRFEPLQRRAQRRRASLVQLAATALLLAGLGAVVAWPQAPLWLVPVAAVALLMPFAVATGRLNASVGGVTELPTPELDEAQRQARDRVYRRAYFVAGLGMLAFMVATFGYADGWVPGAALLALGAIVYFAWLGMPVHMLAWTLPDVEHDA